MKDPRDIILAPVVSEKSYGLIEQGVYTFKVHPSASKPEIRDAVEAIWGVEVIKVNTLNRKGKVARGRRSNRIGHKPDTKRAIVTLAAGERSRCSRTERSHGHSFTQTNQPRSSLPDVVRLLRDHQDDARRSRCSPRSRKTGGRNVYGRKTSRHRGGGHKRQYRIIDFKRTKDGVTAKVAAIEYDPNRTCRIALLHYADGEKAYILAPKGLTVGDHVSSGQGADIKPGNALPLRYIPVGTTVHNVELRPGQGGKIGPLRRHGRAAGRQGGRVRHPAHAVHRDAPRADRLPGHRRRGRQQRARARSRSARPAATAGRACARRPAASP